MLRQFKELFRKELKILLRDRQTILLLFFMPAALIFFLSLAVGGMQADVLIGRKIQTVVENQAQSPKANLLEKKIKSHKLIERKVRPAGMDNDRLFESSKVQAVVVIPRGFDEGDSPVEVYFDPVIDAGYKAAVLSMLTSLTVEVVMGIDNLDAVVANMIVEKTKPNREFPNPLEQTVPGFAIFAMFFIAIPMSIIFLKEKRDGTLPRLFTYPVNANLVTLAKLAPYYIINIFQFILMLLIGVYIMPYFINFSLQWGEHPWHLLPITLIVAAATTGFGVLVASLARTPEQSSTLAALGAVLMGAFGGIMVPYFFMPLVMKKLAMLSPVYWAHQAYLDVFLRGAAFSVILPKLAVLTGFAIICFYLAGRKVKWM
ncbi:MAG TPA: ABC transporter permease [Smithellaceae bacterium]|nr:ABC transporter permease [Smithellaceae bacterium]HRS88084.1 ABC transporter permease [Smithellaceae bacterium]HRV25442.1 ABC transporter permease [Smithellaceae bacterium]